MLAWSLAAYLAEGQPRTRTAFLQRNRLQDFSPKVLLWGIAWALMFLSTVASPWWRSPGGCRLNGCWTISIPPRACSLKKEQFARRPAPDPDRPDLEYRHESLLAGWSSCVELQHGRNTRSRSHLPVTVPVLALPPILMGSVS
jgi:hypothetical protein